ncbi:MAG: hypothetical protein IT260_24235 [Saprospiraceae bacterium]|nr:hypothetical protein [Saprospiraceae bacterium]
MQHPCSAFFFSAIHREGPWQPMPKSLNLSCWKEIFAPAGEGFGSALLGEKLEEASFEQYKIDGIEQPVKVWFRDQDILKIDIFYPTEWQLSPSALQSVYGKAPAVADYYQFTSLLKDKVWVYPSKGLAIFFNADDSRVTQVSLFKPNSRKEYLQTLHPVLEGRRFRKP